MLGLAFNAQAFELAQGIPRYQGGGAFFTCHRIRDMQVGTQLIDGLLGLFDLLLLLRESFFQRLDTILVQCHVLLVTKRPVGFGNRVGDPGGFVGLLAGNANLNEAGVGQGAEIKPRPEQGRGFPRL